ncbi:MAG: hypothetical protein AAGD12_16940 [Pseudomonadota bacterium]
MMTSQTAQHRLAVDARRAIALAATSAGAMLALMTLRDDGAAAIATIAGFPAGEVSPLSLNLALACDFGLPVGYSAGFCLLALNRGGGPLAYGVIAFTLAGAATDFLENGMAASGSPLFGLTLAKYGLLTVAAVLLGAVIRSDRPIDRLAALLFQIGMPLFFALLISGALGPATVWIFAPVLTGTFLLALLLPREVTA